MAKYLKKGGAMLKNGVREYVTVLGFFDGIHIGHKKLISEVK